MKIVIANAFSLSMLDSETQRNRAGDAVYENPRIPRPCDDPAKFLEDWEQAGATVESAVGHADTAALFSSLLSRPADDAAADAYIASVDAADAATIAAAYASASASASAKSEELDWQHQRLIEITSGGDR